jgi:predicted amidohydrolase
MSECLKIAIIPLNITCCDKELNLQHVDEVLSTLPKDIDIIVLPELFSTGFMKDIDLLADMSEATTGYTIQQLNSFARKYNVAICGSYAAKVADKFYNRAFFIEPSGEESYYDKRHLFSMSSESSLFTRGDFPSPIIRFRGWNIAMSICYDLRFPVWCRNTQYCYDVMLVPANWPEVRAYAWRQLLISRAIENQAFVIGANRSGEDEFGKYDNLSYIVDFMGQSIGQQGPQNGIVFASIFKDKLDKFRRNFPVMNDSDEFTIEL